MLDLDDLVIELNDRVNKLNSPVIELNDREIERLRSDLRQTRRKIFLNAWLWVRTKLIAKKYTVSTNRILG